MTAPFSRSFIAFLPVTEYGIGLFANAGALREKERKTGCVQTKLLYGVRTRLTSFLFQRHNNKITECLVTLVTLSGFEPDPTPALLYSSNVKGIF